MNYVELMPNSTQDRALRTESGAEVLPRLTEVTVRRLMDTFDHTIKFPDEWEFVIIFGPNGVGKTRFLELIRGAANLNEAELLQTPFEHLALTFNDGTILSFSKLQQELELPIETEPEGTGNEQARRVCVVTLERPGEQKVRHTWRVEWPGRFERWLEESSPFTKLSDFMWRDVTDGETLSIDLLYERYRHIWPASRSDRSARPRSRHLLRAEKKLPQEISEFASTLSVHLIETQRLIATRMPNPREPWDDVPPVSYTQTVTQHSDDLRNQLSQTVTAHSRLSQQLDRTFPKRIIEVLEVPGSDSNIREMYQSQNELRARLATFSLIDAQGEVALPERQLDSFEIKALSTYLNDTESKLEVFTGLLERLELFVEIMNARLVRKTVSIDVNEGITVRQDKDGPAIPTESLSSGEQHEMVLLYDLLFRTKPNSIVLIDEPEISLHVAWQTEFLSDIMRVARLSMLRFVIATHSPQIIDTWWGRTNELSVG